MNEGCGNLPRICRPLVTILNADSERDFRGIQQPGDIRRRAVVRSVEMDAYVVGAAVAVGVAVGVGVSVSDGALVTVGVEVGTSGVLGVTLGCCVGVELG